MRWNWLPTPFGVPQLRVSVLLGTVGSAIGLLLEAIAVLISPDLLYTQGNDLDPSRVSRNLIAAAALAGLGVALSRLGTRVPARLLGLPTVIGTGALVTVLGIAGSAADAGTQIFYMLAALLAGYYLPRRWAYLAALSVVISQQILVWTVLPSADALHDSFYVPGLLLLATFMLVRVREMDVSAENERVRRASLDPLTGLATRQMMDEMLEQAGEGGERPQISLILVDVDHFKIVNDTFGHPFGDQALIAVAEVLRHLAGPGGIPVRLGGDEFALLCPGADKDAAEERARAIVEHVGAHKFSVNGRPVSILVSVGVATSSDKLRVEWLYRSADRALYRAKRSGCGSAASPVSRPVDAWSTPEGEALGRVGCGKGNDCRRLMAIRRLRGGADMLPSAVRPAAE